MAHRLPALLSVLLCLTLGAPMAMGADDRDYSLTISGGISLGAYQAGFNWGFVNILRDQRQAAPGGQFNLRAVSGASAGNINAFLTTLTWMERDGATLRGGAQNITNNWFYNTWIPVGLDTLFPGGKSCAAYYRDVFLAHFPNPENTEEAIANNCFPLEFDVSRTREGKRLVRDNLLGAENDWTAYRQEDGLFTRRSFDYIMDQIREAVSEPGRFLDPGQPGGRAPLLVGVTVTSATPAKVKLGSGMDTIDIMTQHYVLPMKAMAGKDGLRFFMHEAAYDGKDKATARLNTVAGQALHLQNPAILAPLKIDNIFAAINASSAFPGAFSPVTLTHFICGSQSGGNVCGKEDFKPVKGQFTDGGIFDNVPLGLAVNQTMKEYGGGKGPGVSYVYIDPDTRSLDLQDTCEQTSGGSRGFDFYTGLVKSLVISARQRELLAVNHHFGLTEGLTGAGRPGSDKDGAGGMELLLSRRFSPLAGTFMGAFGAFMDRPLREYDYYAGVYDSIVFFVKSAGGAPSKGRDATSLFLGHALRMADLDPARGIDHRRLASALAKQDGETALLEEYMQSADRRALYVLLSLAQIDSSLSLRAMSQISRRLLGEDLEAIRKDKLGMVMDALLRMEKDKQPCEPENLEALITELRLRGYKDAAEDYIQPVNILASTQGKSKFIFGGKAPSDHMGMALKNFDQWRTTSLRDAAIRLSQIEEIDKNKIGLGFMRLGDYLLRTSPYLNSFIELDPSSIPNREPEVDPTASYPKMALHLFPYTAGLTIFPGSGWYVGYEPRIYMWEKTEKFHMTLRLPVSFYSHGRGEYTQVFAGVHLSMDRLYWPLVSSLRFGPEYYHTLSGAGETANRQSGFADSGFAAAAQVGLLADKISIGARVSQEWGSQVFFSVNDINGTLYWALDMTLKSLD